MDRILRSGLFGHELPLFDHVAVVPCDPKFQLRPRTRLSEDLEQRFAHGGCF